MGHFLLRDLAYGTDPNVPEGIIARVNAAALESLDRVIEQNGHRNRLLELNAAVAAQHSLQVREVHEQLLDLGYSLQDVSGALAAQTSVLRQMLKQQQERSEKEARRHSVKLFAYGLHKKL